MAGTQEQVIGVGQDDVGVEVARQVALWDAFDGCLRADRHEDWCFHHAVSGMEQARARARVGAFSLQLEMHILTVAQAKRNFSALPW